MITCAKRYENFPCAHRAPDHDGHCKLIHGHNWAFDIVFAAERRDQNGFVVDFGKLGPLKEKLTEYFDHTLLLNENDPLSASIDLYLTAHNIGNVVLVLDCSCEGIAELVFNLADDMVRGLTRGRAGVVRVTAHEDTKNSATYRP
jgi:6-pyruvoyltetrahydropterin/6-carboxytetrahydropterin synthase